jgi:hypothetical protein
VELCQPRRLAQLPGERMLASARPDDKHLHDRESSGCARRV